MASNASSHTTEGNTCPLCHQPNSQPFAQLPQGNYWLCKRCHYTYLAPQYWLTASEEAKHYQLHDNRIDDPHYLKFLSRLSEPLVKRLPANAKGIDIGCGPGPALAHSLTQQGYPCAYYDPLFFPNAILLNSQYDFVTATEVVEHLRDPATTWQQLRSLVKPGGLLAIMTSWRVAKADFPQWHYPRDPTHIGFYQPDTFKWLAEQWGWQISFPVNNVCIFERPLL